MEKIPYKIGDILTSPCEDGDLDDLEVIDFSQNGKVVFTSGLYTNIESSFYTKRELDDLGYELKSPTTLKTPDKVETPAKWVPRKHQVYFYLNDSGEVGTAIWGGREISNFRLKINNVFKTEREAKEARDKIMNS